MSCDRVNLRAAIAALTGYCSEANEGAAQGWFERLRGHYLPHLVEAAEKCFSEPPCLGWKPIDEDTPRDWDKTIVAGFWWSTREYPKPIWVVESVCWQNVGDPADPERSGWMRHNEGGAGPHKELRPTHYFVPPAAPAHTVVSIT